MKHLTTRVAGNLDVIVRSITRPGWQRTLWTRRITAALLALAGITLTIQTTLEAKGVPVVVAAHDLRPGIPLTASHLRIQSFSKDSVPAGVSARPSEIIGHTVSGPVQPGEPLTVTRLLKPRLASAATGIAHARIVAVSLADSQVATLVREGDIVDVIAAPERDTHRAHNTDTPPAVLAQSAVVVTIPGNQANKPAKAGSKIIMLALPHGDANNVASANLVRPLGIIFH